MEGEVKAQISQLKLASFVKVKEFLIQWLRLDLACLLSDHNAARFVKEPVYLEIDLNSVKHAWVKRLCLRLTLSKLIYRLEV